MGIVPSDTVALSADSYLEAHAMESNVRREPRAALGASVSTAWLGGKLPTSQILRLQAHALGDSGKHPRPDLFAVVKREDSVWPAGPGEGFVRTGLALERPADPVKSREYTIGL